uniref:Uncharacterized protein n=1 Tax=Anguilla anguilla TaxID=7936 RepID=A0A0E9UJG6_ANGAN
MAITQLPTDITLDWQPGIQVITSGRIKTAIHGSIVVCSIFDCMI